MPPSSAPVVVATDFSAAATEATAYALRLAQATGASVHLLHAVPRPDAGPFESPGEALSAQEKAEEVARAHDALVAVAAEAGAGDRVTLAVRHGDVPAAEIRDYARAVGAGLVVMGTCGRRPRLHGLGAVTAETVQTAPCDVLLVPHREGAPYSSTPPHRVLVPVDFSSASRTLVALAVGLARALGADGVDLVHVLEPLPHPVRWIEEALVDVVPEIRERAEGALRDLAADLGGVGEDIDVALYVERGKASRTVPRVADALGDDLVVIGPHAERPVFDRLLGSVAEGVARRARCPVLVARQSATSGSVGGRSVDARSVEAA